MQYLDVSTDITSASFSLKFDQDLHISYASPGFMTAFGLPTKDCSGLTLEQAGFPCDDAAFCEAILRRAIESGRETSEAYTTSISGEKRIFGFSVIPHLIKDQTELSVTATWHEITENIHILEMLREDLHLFRSLFDSTLQYIGLLSADGTLLEINQSALLAGGLKHEEVINRPFWEMGWWTISPAIQAQLERAVARAALGEHVRYETEIRGAARGTLTIDFSIKPLLNEYGKPALLLAEGRDITDRKKIEMQIRQHTLRLETLNAVSQDLAATILDFQVTLDVVARRIALQIGDLCVIGLLSDDNNQINTVAVHHTIPEAMELVDQLKRNPQPVDEGIINTVIDSGQSVLISTATPEQMKSLVSELLWSYLERFEACSLLIAPLRAQNRTIGTISLIRDHCTPPYTTDDQTLLQELADRAALAIQNARLYADNLRYLETLEERVKQRTAELEKTNLELHETLTTLNATQEELVRSEKLSSLGSLVAGIAHELNTPIGNSVTVGTTLQYLTKDFKKLIDSGVIRRSDLQKYLDNTMRASDLLLRNLNTAGNLIGSFKQVAVDQTSEQRRTFDLKLVLEEILTTLYPVFKKTPYKIELETPEGIKMDSYPGPLGQVITNLVNNARLHAFEGSNHGVVQVTTRPFQNNLVEITVTDDGVGISPDIINRIFDPFFTTRLGRGGSGLGLNIVYNIVTGVLGGKVSVESQPGAGARFSLVLPLNAPEQ